MDYWVESLDSLIVIVKQRVETLGGTFRNTHHQTQNLHKEPAIYKQIYADAKIQLENFAFGMVSLSLLAS